jgi:glycosyltransferase involved in cell wall biosynthesis
MLSGSDPHPRIKALASDRVTVTGWVDDIRTSYAQSKIFVAPMFIGTGLQNKLLEAMAMKLPCITTKLANNALGATDEENILLAEESDEFADKIIRLLTQNEVANQIINNAKSFVQENYSWKKQNNLLISLIQKGRK